MWLFHILFWIFSNLQANLFKRLHFKHNMVYQNIAALLDEWYASRVKSVYTAEFESNLERSILNYFETLEADSTNRQPIPISVNIHIAMKNALIYREDQVQIASHFFTEIFVDLAKLFGTPRNTAYVSTLEVPFARPQLNSGDLTIDLTEFSAKLESLLDDKREEFGVVEYDFPPEIMKNLAKAYSEIYEFMSNVKNTYDRYRVEQDCTKEDLFRIIHSVFMSNFGVERFTKHYKSLILARKNYLDNNMPRAPQEELDGLEILYLFIEDINSRVFADR